MIFDVNGLSPAMALAVTWYQHHVPSIIVIKQPSCHKYFSFQGMIPCHSRAELSSQFEFSQPWSALQSLFECPPRGFRPYHYLIETLAIQHCVNLKSYINTLRPVIHPTKGLWAHNSNFATKNTLALKWQTMIQSCHRFARATTAELSWHVQNCDLIWSKESKSEQIVHEISIMSSWILCKISTIWQATHLNKFSWTKVLYFDSNLIEFCC